MAQTVTLGIPEARAIAERAALSGQFAVARSLALGLLQRDPNEFAALMILTTAEIGLGNWDAAVNAGRRAFRATDLDMQRVNAARLVASAHFRAGQHTRAELWLGRALTLAPDAGARAALRQDFAKVRQSNPLSVRLSFSTAPNNNVNNGSSSDTVTVWFIGVPLPFTVLAESRALSGFEASAGVDLSYRLAQSGDRATNIGVKFFGRTYELSKEAQAAAHSVTGSDFSFALVETFLTHSRRYPNTSGPTNYTLTVGQNWYGGEPYTKYGRITVAQNFRVSETTGVDLSGGYERQISIRGGGTPSDIHTLGTTYNYRLTNRDVIRLSLRVQETTSPSASLENTSLKAGFRYAFAHAVLGTRL